MTGSLHEVLSVLFVNLGMLGDLWSCHGDLKAGEDFMFLLFLISGPAKSHSYLSLHEASH
jgi:hypothetical protein